MKKYLFTIFFTIFMVYLYAQSNIKLQHFDCYNNNVSIPLPEDFKGPKYFNYEEGSIIDFFSPTDTCVVSILCGGDAELKLDSTYQVVNTKKISVKGERITYYSKTLNRYARKDYLEEYLIMYDRANAARKDELDKVFDKLETK